MRTGRHLLDASRGGDHRWLVVAAIGGAAALGWLGPVSPQRRAVAVSIDRPDAEVFFVSPRGRDAWSGRAANPTGTDGPFATVGRARAAVRELLKARPGSPRVRVELRGGTYYLDAPLEFGPDDSGTETAPVVYTAAAGEKVVLSGGRRLKGGRWGEVNGHKAWVVDIPAVKSGAC
jgi:hypothetical protein